MPTPTTTPRPESEDFDISIRLADVSNRELRKILLVEHVIQQNGIIAAVLTANCENGTDNAQRSLDVFTRGNSWFGDAENSRYSTAYREGEVKWLKQVTAELNALNSKKLDKLLNLEHIGLDGTSSRGSKGSEAASLKFLLKELFGCLSRKFYPCKVTNPEEDDDDLKFISDGEPKRKYLVGLNERNGQAPARNTEIVSALIALGKATKVIGEYITEKFYLDGAKNAEEYLERYDGCSVKTISQKISQYYLDPEDIPFPVNEKERLLKMLQDL